MLSFLIAASLALCLFADTECPTVSTHEDRRTNKSLLRVVTYNVEWLFVDYYKSADCPGNGCPWHNDTAARTHIQYVADVINELNPDIMNLCEIEGCDEINALVKQLGSGSQYKGYLKKGTDTATGQNNALLTKVDPSVSLYRTEDRADYPIPGSKCGSPYTGDTAVSKHYITEFKVGSTNIAMIGAHLKAYPTDPSSCAQREGQAQVLQNVVYDYIVNKKYEVILMGDLNDYDAEILDINNNKPTSVALDILKGNAGVYKGKFQLNNIASQITQADRYSEWWDSDNNCATNSATDYSMIDHMLVSNTLYNKISNVFIYNKSYNGSCYTYNSDHFPVVIDIAV